MSTDYAKHCAPDCLERQTCPDAGTLGHSQCGMCEEHPEIPVHHCTGPHARNAYLESLEKEYQNYTTAEIEEMWAAWEGWAYE